MGVRQEDSIFEPIWAISDLVSSCLRIKNNKGVGDAAEDKYDDKQKHEMTPRIRRQL